MNESRVAVVGAGAWGTTLAALVARTEPVLLLCHAAGTAAAIRDTGRNERRLPGIPLPDAEGRNDARIRVHFAVGSRNPRRGTRVLGVNPAVSFFEKLADKLQIPLRFFKTAL